MWRPRCLLRSIEGENQYGHPITGHERDRVILDTDHVATIKHISRTGEILVGAEAHTAWDEWVSLDSIDTVLR